MPNAQCVTAPACEFISSIHTPQAGAHGGRHMQLTFFRKLVQRIREEFEEAPGLRVTLSEAARFWGLDLATCERVLTELLSAGFLARGADERYRQATM
jgi:Fic family protein